MDRNAILQELYGLHTVENAVGRLLRVNHALAPYRDDIVQEIYMMLAERAGGVLERLYAEGGIAKVAAYAAGVARRQIVSGTSAVYRKYTMEAVRVMPKDPQELWEDRRR